MKLITAADAAKKWGISPRRVSILCNEGRIPGAEKLGRSWLLPEEAEKPRDGRKTVPSPFSYDFAEDEAKRLMEAPAAYQIPMTIAIDADLYSRVTSFFSANGEDINTAIGNYLRSRLEETSTEKRIGALRGCIQVPDDIDSCNKEIEELFLSL